jgi:hypothetical protein
LARALLAPSLAVSLSHFPFQVPFDFIRLFCKLSRVI